jgi:hypothetical protein
MSKAEDISNKTYGRLTGVLYARIYNSNWDVDVAFNTPVKSKKRGNL